MEIIVDKYFSKEDNLFYVIKENTKTYNKIEQTFNSFEKFYEAINKSLLNSNLLDYDFKNIDITQYDFTGAKISSSIMIKLGMYNNDLFEIVTKNSELSNIMPSDSIELVPSRGESIEISESDNFAVCYISDLHLDHKILKRFQKNINEFELSAYFNDIIQKLKNSLPKFTRDYCIVFIGDISYNFEVFKRFFTEYRKEIPFNKTFVILGNHELWDSELNNSCNSIEKIVEAYRSFLLSLDEKIHLLENQIYFPFGRQEIFTEEEILSASNNDLRKKFLLNGYAIFGGMGYSGLNNDFNYKQGIYRTQHMSREQEIERSNKVDALHKKLTEVGLDKKVFFVTHMPKEDWSLSNYNSNWIYISGHTHKNYYVNTEEKKVFCDNQIGYTSNSFGLKYTTAASTFDVFQDYTDGIYKITRDQYKLFYYGISKRSITFNRPFDRLYMLKRSGTYCFFLKLINSNELKLLNGGSIKNIGKLNIKYFYDNMLNYSNSVKLFLDSYERFQEKVSSEIKKIGGTGHIHGSIVDIDFYNHLFINPIDGKITPYSASSMEDKYVYSNFISLLKSNNKELYNNYINLLGVDSNKKSLSVLSSDLIESNKKTYVPETDMYRISRIISGLSYTTKYNVIRLWSDTILANATAENGKLIVSGMLNPDEMEKIKKEQRQKEKKEKQRLKYMKQKPKKKTMPEEEKVKVLFDRYSEKLAKQNINIKLLKYEGSRKKAEYECLQCGYIWGYRPDHYSERYKYRCPKCKK